MTNSSGTSRYDTWQVGPARAGDIIASVASKPGVMAHGTVDAPATMLAAAVAGAPSTMTGARSLHLGSGNGLVPAVALAAGYIPIAFDRYFANAEATRRSLVATAAATAADGDAPAHDGVAHHAASVSPHVGAAECQLATIRLPTDKLGMQLAVAEAFRALAIGGRCLLAGANDEGAKPAAKLLEQVFGPVRLDAQHSGCRMLSAVKQRDTPLDAMVFASPWLDAERFHTFSVNTGGTAFTVATRPGVFSWQHLDEASGILADLMRVDDGETVLDLGCGAGVLGVVAARQTPAGSVLLLDADADAVRCAARTAALAHCANVEVRASDVSSGADDRTFDVVVSNPPFHLGKGTELAIPRAFIDQAYNRLVRGGRLYLVANRTLPYEGLIADRFGEVRTAHDGRRFKVIGGVRRN
jgi:16S rRNA (guanine1207-N2)-methyltransferase